MKTLSLTSIALALSVTAASAQDYVQAQIDSLFAQGYTHFSVRRGVLNSSVEAYSSTGLETTVVLNNSTGAVVRQRVETNDATTVAGTIQKIEQKHVDDVDGSDDVLVEVTTATGDTILVEANEMRRAPRTGSDDVYTTVTTSTGETAYVEVDDHNYKDDTDHVGGSDDRYGSDNNGYEDRSHDNDDGNDHDGRDDNDDGNDHDDRDDNDDGDDDHGSDHDD
ncbi:hypothetical protein [Celeribacter marinus]|uniref:Zinc ABC transporter, periplasmic-binding protein ZnuA n=1 Tax=Celeribacter marinus TaxID=1397108 RepID=A0A0P0A775_9RHOB|nr:hypothetical protein [Celeribacter marinus]ALI56583.1 zinc ABC transporter, periplasmic-binding protein ZnuA [Celeribacter marinus]SFK59540.1 hypothetical protein SAMN05444421_10624 [Celeribacter marinus]